MGLRELGACQIELGRRRGLPRFGIFQRLPRQELALEQVLRSLEVAGRELQVGLALADGRLRHRVGGFGLLDLLVDLLILDAGQRLPAANPVAELDVDGHETAGRARHDVDGGGADEIADHVQLGGDVAGCGRGYFDGHRRTERAAAAGPPAAAAGAAAGPSPTAGATLGGSARLRALRRR